jgi:hypothetical protein
MKKINLKLFTALLAVVLVAGASIFYACKKEKDNNSDKNLTKEAEFIARIHEKLCVQVDVFRDEHNNVHIMTKETDNAPEVRTGIIIPNTMNIKPQNAKNKEEDVGIEIPNDAIHWVVPLDGNDPEKVPSGGGSTQLKGTCNCTEGSGCWDKPLSCPPPKTKTDQYGTWLYCPSPSATLSCCNICELKLVSVGAANYVAMGSILIVQSNTITVNGITYE